MSRRVPVDGDLDVPGSQLAERGTLIEADLAGVLVEDVDSVAVEVHQRFEAASRADNTELAVVADMTTFAPAVSAAASGRRTSGSSARPASSATITLRASKASWP